MLTGLFDLDLAPAPEDLRVIREGLRAFTDARAGYLGAEAAEVFPLAPVTTQLVRCAQNARSGMDKQ